MAETNNKDAMFSLIRNAIDSTALPDNLNIYVKELYALSKKHDLAHIVFDAAIRNRLITKDNEYYDKLSKTIMVAISRYQQQNYQLIRIKECFQKNSIVFVPLKGSIIRDYYPQPWMRTSCDIDILIHEEDSKRASEALLSIGFTTDGIRDYNEISFFFGNVHLELHFNICEANKRLDVVLSKVWNYVEQYNEFEYRQTNSFFLFYHIAHMVYHFLFGGCGIRPFLDLWILRQKYDFDEAELLELLNKSHLVSFYNNACLLSEIWFSGKEHTEITLRMERYIIDGGTYGNSENRAASGVASHKGSKTKYKLSIAFPPYVDMCNWYPSLKKHKILLPFCYIHRFFSKVFGKKSKSVRKRSKSIDNCSKDKVDELTLLLNDLELNLQSKS